MGIPYSKQINAAFDEVTPLVAAGFDVLRTSRNISILLAVVQVVTALTLALILLALLALLVSVNPDLEAERRAVVTPAVQWLAAWVIERTWLRIVVGTVPLGLVAGGLAGWWITSEAGPRLLVEVDQSDEAGGEGVADEETSGS